MDLSEWKLRKLALTCFLDIFPKGGMQIIKIEIYDVFSMKGGVSSSTYLFWKMIFLKNHLESFPDCENVFCT